MEFVRHIDDGLVVFNFFLTDLRKRDHTYEKFSEKKRDCNEKNGQED